jgi:hypothetical protein
MQSVIVTPSFESDAKHAGLSAEDVEAIILWLAANPLAGDLMKGTAAPGRSALQAKVRARAVAIALSTTSAEMTFRCSCSP